MKRSSLARFRALLAPACLLLAGCRASDGGPCGLVHVTDLPLTVRGHKFYTTISINGKAVDVMFDTGSEDNLIAVSTARALGMWVNLSGYDYMAGIGGEVAVGTARTEDVRMGDAHGTKLDFMTIRDHDAHFDGDGILGMNFLYNYDLDLDFWGGRLGLYKTIGRCDMPAAALAHPLFSADLVEPAESSEPLRQDIGARDLSPGVNVVLNGVKLRADVDTGSFQTTIFRDSARHAGLVGDEIIARTEITGAGPRVVKASIRKVAQLQIGELTLANVPVIVADQRHPPGVDMLLGYDFVTRIHLWISRSSKTLIMQYPPKPTVVASEEKK